MKANFWSQFILAVVALLIIIWLQESRVRTEQLFSRETRRAVQEGQAFSRVGEIVGRVWVLRHKEVGEEFKEIFLNLEGSGEKLKLVINPTHEFYQEFADMPVGGSVILLSMRYADPQDNWSVGAHVAPYCNKSAKLLLAEEALE